MSGKAFNLTKGVLSFNGRTGSVLPKPGDFTAEDVGAVPTTEKGDAGGVATLGTNGQMPYVQTPHLTENVTLYVDATAGDDANPGTQIQPYKTIQAAVDSLPKDLGGFIATINVAAGNYPENVKINGFYNGKFSGALKIAGSSAKDQTRTIGSIFASNCDTHVSISGVCLNGNESGYSFDSEASDVDLISSIIDGTSSTAVVGVGCGNWGFANLRIFYCDIDGFDTSGVLIGNGILEVNSVAINNCGVGLTVGSSGAGRQGLCLVRNVTYQNCTSNTQTYGNSQIFGG